MKLAGLVLVSVMSTAALAGPSDNKQTWTHDCAKEPSLHLTGNENTVTVTGTCKNIIVGGNKNKLTVAAVTDTGVGGNENTIIVEATDRIVVTGNKNTVTYTKLLSKPKIHVANTGKDNSVTQSK